MDTMSPVHFLAALSALRLRDWKSVEHGARFALRWLSVHTGIPALVVAAILVVVGWRILKKSLRLVVEIVLVGALLFAASQAGGFAGSVRDRPMTRAVSDEDLHLAATSLLRSVLGLASGERFVAVGDAESSRILDALERAAKEAGGEPTSLRLDRLRSHSTNHTGERPHKVLPDAVRRAMLTASASVFVASAPYAELSMRDQLLHVSTASGGRHVHMPATSELAFACGSRADFDEIRAEGRALERTLEVAQAITAESDAGTKLTVQTGAGRRWVSRFGTVRAGECVQLPAGSLVTCADTVSGTFVADASVGEYFGARAGLLEAPVTFEIVNGRVMNVLAPHSAELARDIENMLHVAPNSDRVGLVVIGLNAGIGEATGDAEVDQHRVGLHLVFGDPVGRLTGATWSARTTFAACQKQSVVRVDGVRVG